ncbi:MAG: HAMP domain-containing histidine kinase [Treponema sp.]|nr:HAMP domain-containing histidine kinase [Treponema sp.]
MKYPALLKRISHWILGDQDDTPLSPDRMRKEYLVQFLLVLLPIIVSTLSIDIFRGPDVFTVTRIGASLSLALCLILLKLNLYGAAIPVLFFGGTISVAAALIPSAIYEKTSGALMPLAALVFFAAIVLIGLYSDKLRCALGLLIIAITFDILELFFNSHLTPAVINARFGVVILHISALGVNTFLRHYFDRVNQIAEARRIMNRHLEKLIADTRQDGLDRLASLTHDLRSPITSIMGVQALLAATELTEEQKTYVDILSRSNKLMFDLVQSILEPEVQDDKTLERKVNLVHLVDRALGSYRILAQAKGLAVTVSIPENIPRPDMPKAEFIRIIENLMDNAIKYTNAGSITISARKKTENKKPFVVLTISDTGQGISAERLAEIKAGTISPDEQFTTSHGLGLSGAIEKISQAGGSLDITSSPGRGTTITLILPA